jgi:putative effector of murein hydrolase
MIDILSSPLFYLGLTIFIYFVFAWLSKKIKTPLFNPLLWTIVFIVGYILLITFTSKGNLNQENIVGEYEKYAESTKILDLMLTPVTVSLALPLYLNRKILKENWVAILVATIVGTSTSILTVWGMSNLLGLEKDIMYALFPRGVTTAIAKEIASILGVSAQESITVIVVCLTGVVGAVLGPILIRLFQKQDDVVIGLSLGSSSHAIGTSKAFDYSSKAGAIATVSIITNGLLTFVVALIISLF